MKFSLLRILMFIINSFAYSQISTDSLKCHLPFTNNSLDVSGNENHATIYGAVLTEDRFGNNNSAYFLNGIEDYIEIFNSNISNYKEVTISFWFKPFNNLNQNSEPEILLQSDRAGDTDGHFLIGFNRTNCLQFPSTNDGKINFEVQGDLVNGNSQNCSAFGLTRVSSNTNSWQNNEWHMITAIISNDELKIYVDSQLENTYNSTSGVFLENEDIIIGGYIDFGNQDRSAFHGSIDDLLIYNRAISENEIVSLFEDGLSNLSNLELFDNVVFYPNPFHDAIEIKFQEKLTETVNFQVYDSNGTLVRKGKLESHSHRIKFDPPMGIYIIILTNDSKQIISSKIIAKSER